MFYKKVIILMAFDLCEQVNRIQTQREAKKKSGSAIFAWRKTYVGSVTQSLYLISNQILVIFFCIVDEIVCLNFSMGFCTQ